MNKKKKSSRIFWIFYLSFVILLCVFCIVGLKITNTILEDYESSQPYKVVERYLEKIESGDYSYTFGFAEFTQTDFAKTEDCIEILRQRYENKELTYLESSSHLGLNKIRYNIYGNGERVGYVILSMSENKTKYGFNTWKIESCEPFEFLEKYTVTVPKGYTLYADGVVVNEKYITNTETDTEYPEINGKESPTYITYEVYGFIQEPVFSVDSLYGEEYIQTVTEETRERRFDRKEIYYNSIYGFVQEAMSEYIQVISLEKEMENYLQYVLEGSEYANIVKNFNSAWIMYKPEVFGSSLENFEVLRYKEYTETQILAEISFDYIVKLQYNTETYHSEYKIILIKTENGWKIANMENI